MTLGAPLGWGRRLVATSITNYTRFERVMTLVYIVGAVVLPSVARACAAVHDVLAGIWFAWFALAPPRAQVQMFLNLAFVALQVRHPPPLRQSVRRGPLS